MDCIVTQLHVFQLIIALYYVQFIQAHYSEITTKEVMGACMSYWKHIQARYTALSACMCMPVCH